MRYVGFIKEHDNIPEAIGFGDAKNSEFKCDRDKIEQYLNQGIFLFGWMGYVSDLETNDLIAPDCYYTDGTWVWPSYFPYYLKKFPNLEIDEDFIEFLNDKKYEFTAVENFGTMRKVMEEELLKKFMG